MGDGMTPRAAEPYSSAELARANEVLRYHDARMAATVDVLRVARERAEQQLAAITDVIDVATAWATSRSPRDIEAMSPVTERLYNAVRALLDASTTEEPVTPARRNIFGQAIGPYPASPASDSPCPTCGGTFPHAPGYRCVPIATLASDSPCPTPVCICPTWGEMSTGDAQLAALAEMGEKCPVHGIAPYRQTPEGP